MRTYKGCVEAREGSTAECRNVAHAPAEKMPIMFTEIFDISCNVVGVEGIDSKSIICPIAFGKAIVADADTVMPPSAIAIILYSGARMLKSFDKDTSWWLPASPYGNACVMDCRDCRFVSFLSFAF